MVSITAHPDCRSARGRHVRFCRLENLQPGREKVSFDFVGGAFQLFRIPVCARLLSTERGPVARRRIEIKSRDAVKRAGCRRR